MPSPIRDEYDSLRKEIYEWQNRRFSILAVSGGFVAAILGLKIVEESKQPQTWPVVSALLLLFLSAACLLTWYTRRATSSRIQRSPINKSSSTT